MAFIEPEGKILPVGAIHSAGSGMLLLRSKCGLAFIEPEGKTHSVIWHRVLTWSDVASIKWSSMGIRRLPKKLTIWKVRRVEIGACSQSVQLKKLIKILINKH